MPLRICVIGTRTSSAPAGKAIRRPAGAFEAGSRGRDGGGGGGACRGGGCRGRSGDGAGADGLDVGEDVLAGHATAAARAGDLARLEAVLAEETTHGGGHACVGVSERLAGRRGEGRVPGPTQPGQGGKGGRRGGDGRGHARVPRPARRSRPVAVPPGGRGARRGGCGARDGNVGLIGRVDHRDLGVVRDGGPLGREDLAEDAGERRRDLGVHLVGDDLEQRLVLGDGVAGLLEPASDRALSHALAELGHRHLGHWAVPPVRTRDAAVVGEP